MRLARSLARAAVQLHSRTWRLPALLSVQAARPARCYKTFPFILEKYPTLTRVSASLKRSPARRKNVRFAFCLVDALGQFCSVLRIAQNGNFWVQNACQSGVIF